MKALDVVGLGLVSLNLGWAAASATMNGGASPPFVAVLAGSVTVFLVTALAARRVPWAVPLALVAAGLAVLGRAFADLASAPGDERATSAFFLLAVAGALLLPVHAPTTPARIAAPPLVGLFSVVPLLDSSLAAFVGLLLLLLAPLAALRPWGVGALIATGAALMLAMIGVQGPEALGRLAGTGLVGGGLLLALVGWGLFRLGLRPASPAAAAIAAMALAASAAHAQIAPIWQVPPVPAMLAALLGSAVGPTRGNHSHRTSRGEPARQSLAYSA